VRTSDDIEGDLRECHSQTVALALALHRYDEQNALNAVVCCYAEELAGPSSKSIIEIWARRVKIRSRRKVVNAVRRLLPFDWDPFDGIPPDPGGDEEAQPAFVRWQLLQLNELQRAVVVLVLHNGVTVRDAAAVMGCGETKARSSFEEARSTLLERLDPHTTEHPDPVGFLRKRLARATADLDLPAFGLVWARAKTHRRERRLKVVLGTIGAIGLAISIIMIILGIGHLKDQPAARKPGMSIPAERFFDKTQ
jgi:hypothetical protein